MKKTLLYGLTSLVAAAGTLGITEYTNRHREEVVKYTQPLPVHSLSRPRDVYGMLFTGLEGTLEQAAQKEYTTLMNTACVMTGMVERQGDRLRYVEFQEEGGHITTEVDVSGMPSNTIIPLEQFRNTGLPEAVYGRRYEELPQEVKEGPFRAYVTLPARGTQWTLGLQENVGKKYDIAPANIVGEPLTVGMK